jgi:hypothetical protein
MSDDKLPEPVRAFIASNLSSIEQLEILCLMFTSPGAEWTAEAVYRKVLTTMPSVEQTLGKFVAAGLLERSHASVATFRPLTGLPVQDRIIELCRLYREMPARIIETIYQKDARTTRDFSDAFKLKRKP